MIVHPSTHRGSWIVLMMLAALGGGCAASDLTREEDPTPGSQLGDLERYRGQRPLVHVLHGNVTGPGEVFEAVAFEDGLVLGEANGCQSPSTLRRRRLSAEELSTLRSFLSGLRSRESMRDCDHSAFYAVSWLGGRHEQSLVDNCDGQFDPRVKETVLKVLEVLGVADLPTTSCEPWAPAPGVIWQLVGRRH